MLNVYYTSHIQFAVLLHFIYFFVHIQNLSVNMKTFSFLSYSWQIYIVCFIAVRKQYVIEPEKKKESENKLHRNGNVEQKADINEQTFDGVWRWGKSV